MFRIVAMLVTYEISGFLCKDDETALFWAVTLRVVIILYRRFGNENFQNQFLDTILKIAAKD